MSFLCCVIQLYHKLSNWHKFCNLLMRLTIDINIDHQLYG
jgi:hypothetical protein